MRGKKRILSTGEETLFTFGAPAYSSIKCCKLSKHHKGSEKSLELGQRVKNRHNRESHPSTAGGCDRKVHIFSSMFSAQQGT